MKELKKYFNFCLLAFLIAIAGLILLFCDFLGATPSQNKDNSLTQAANARVYLSSDEDGLYVAIDDYVYEYQDYIEVPVGSIISVSAKTGGFSGYFDVSCGFKVTKDNKHYGVFGTNMMQSFNLTVTDDIYIIATRSVREYNFAVVNMIAQTRENPSASYTNSTSGGTAKSTNVEPYYSFNFTATVNSGYVFDGFYEVNWQEPSNYKFVSNSTSFKYYTYESNYYYIYARFTKSVKFNVVFNSNIGAGSQTVSQQFTQNISQKLRNNTFERLGYTFKGWSTSSSSSAITYSNGQTVSLNRTTDLTLYAVWQANSYLVTANANGGTITSGNNYWSGNSSSMTRYITYADSYNPLPSVSKTGYYLSGWKNNSNNMIISNSTKMNTAANHTIMAQWSPNTYTITYYSNDGNTNSYSQNVVYDSNVVILSEKFAREGYLLKGWATSAGGGVVYKLGQNMTYKTAASLKLYAVWEETWLNRKTEPNKIGNVYQVATAENLAWAVSCGNNASFVQTDKIDLNDYTWFPLGVFKGSYDGQGFPILNIKTGYIENKANNDYGLFGKTDGAILKNIRLLSGVIEGDNRIGGIVGNANNSYLLNCTNKASVVGKNSNVGGIAGLITGASNLDACYNYGLIQGGGYVGGLLGCVENGKVTVKNSLAYCAITRGSNVGGLVGKVDCEFLMEGCIFNGRLPSGAYAFVSSMAQGKIEDCLSVENTGVSINAGATSYFNNCKYFKAGNEYSVGNDFSNWVDYNGMALPKGVYWIVVGI